MKIKSATVIYDSVLIFLFLIAISIPFFNTSFLRQKSKSEVEKRNLSALPAFPRSLESLRRFPDDFENFFQDNFGFRNQLTYLYNLFKYRIGDSPSERVIIGKDGWLFYNGDKYTDPVGDYRNVNVFENDTLKAFVYDTAAKRNWLKKRAIDYLIVIAPNKHTIYPEKLPSYIKKVSDQSTLDQVINYTKEHSDVIIVDLRNPLLANKKDGLVYLRSDTHWNYYGANIAQYEIAKRVADFFPDKIAPVLYHRGSFLKNMRKGGDLANFIGLRKFFEEDEPVPVWDNICKLRYIPSVRGLRDTFTTECNHAGLNAIIFRDSFFTKVQPFFSAYFACATYIWAPIEFNILNRYVEKEQPDIVIEEWAERTLPVRIKNSKGRSAHAIWGSADVLSGSESLP